MKTVAFRYTVVLGKLDHVPCVVNVDITEEDYARIEASYDSEKYMSMEDDASLEDIVDIVYKTSLELDAESYMDQPEELVQIIIDSKEVEEDEAEEIALNVELQDVVEMLEDLYPRKIGYPEEFGER